MLPNTLVHGLFRPNAALLTFAALALGACSESPPESASQVSGAIPQAMVLKDSSEPRSSETVRQALIEAAAGSAGDPQLVAERGQARKPDRNSPVVRVLPPPPLAPLPSVDASPAPRDGQIGANASNYDDTWPESTPAPLLPELSVHDYSGRIRWEPTEREMSSAHFQAVEYDTMDVSVAGPEGIAIRQNFRYGEPAELDQPLPDGTYTWEAYAAPVISAEVKRQMREVRERGDMREEHAFVQRLQQDGVLPTAAQVESGKRWGVFSIVDGRMVDATETEF